MLNLLRPFVAYTLFMTILVVIVCPANIWAQDTRQRIVSSSKTYYYASGAECHAAVQGGYASFYKPTYFSLFKKVGQNEELRTLEADQCFLMLTVQGYRWVAQKEGTQVVVSIRDGEAPRVVRRYDCGNPIRDTYHKPVPEPLPTPQPTPQPTPKGCPPGSYPGEEPGVCYKDIPGEKETIDKTCKPGKSDRILEHHDKKGFNPESIIRTQIMDQKVRDRLLSLMDVTEATVKVTSLIIYSNGCDYAVYAHSVIKKGLGWWKWIIPAAIAGAFLLGYYLRPKCKNCGTTKVTPIKTTPTSGSQVPIRIIRY